MKIKILGPGCPRCHELEALTRGALAELDMEAEVEHISDISKFVEYGVFLTPGLVINSETKAFGRLPTQDEIKKWIQEEVS